jgi:hypothetical protein
MRPSRFRERVAAAARGALLDWRSGIYMTAGGGGLCGLLLGAVMSVPFAQAQSSTILGRTLMGLFDCLIGGIAGCVFGSVVGALLGIVTGLLGSPILFGVAVITEGSQSARNDHRPHGPGELAPADTPGGRGNEPTPAGGSRDDDAGN